MPYKCNVCGKMYPESSEELRDVMVRGSCTCGKRFLMYIRKDNQEHQVKFDTTPEDVIDKPSKYLPRPDAAVEQIIAEAEPEVQEEEEESPYLPAKDEEEEAEEKKPEEKKDEPLGWLDQNLRKVGKDDEPLYLSIETIKVLEEGKYHIDVTSLMGGKPVIVKDTDGVYYIDVPYAMKKKEKKD